MKRSERSSMKKEKDKLLEEVRWMRMHYIVIRPLISIVAEYLRFK